MKKIIVWYQAREEREKKLLKPLVILSPFVLVFVLIQVVNNQLEDKREELLETSKLISSVSRHQSELREYSQLSKDLGAGRSLPDEIEKTLELFNLQPDKLEESQGKQTVIIIEFSEVRFDALLKFLHRIDIAYQAQVSQASIKPIEDKLGMVRAKIDIAV